ncbi:hypothetical protein CPT_Stills23 [Bacillus phage Stills]|uniref:Uncharacterized protein n=1 Tax=Bacillus phage Stills TaxID=1610833 RepID=A0A0E3T5J3_9CAUD|nr:hypothetical protein CPT_Stills23 [Bacillus phage Stills]AKC02651.1 hypothetical protein CPT_Stills23 [Bacillus phage Stills]
MDYEMTVTYKNEEVDVFNVPFGAHDLFQFISMELDAIIFDDEDGKEQVIYQSAIQKITFRDKDDD